MMRSQAIRPLFCRPRIADQAAQLRAEHKLRTPDALQAATALACEATALISNDTVFQRVPILEVAVLDEMLTPD